MNEKYRTFSKITFEAREYNIAELRELLKLVELQETNDRFTSTQIRINGDDALIEVDIDEDGNVHMN